MQDLNPTITFILSLVGIAFSSWLFGIRLKNGKNYDNTLNIISSISSLGAKSDYIASTLDKIDKRMDKFENRLEKLEEFKLKG